MNAFTEFGLLIGIATLFAIFATKFKQPSILGYIIAGLVIQILGKFHLDHNQLELFSTIGITLLLFILGLELDINELKSLGKTSIITGLGQVLFSTLAGFLISIILGYSFQASIFISIGLAFSSTIIVVKLLSSQKKLENLYGRLSIGFLLVQDFAAILFLVILSGISKFDQNSGGITSIMTQLGLTLLKGLLVGIFVYLFVKYILNPLLNWVRSDKEVLFFVIIAWALLLGALMESEWVGFSSSVGGLVAGVSLSNRFEHLQIESWLKPLRDFFLMIFFVLLGLQLDIGLIKEVLLSSIIISIFVLISKPLIVIFLLKILGFTKKVSFFTGIAIAQISEFSIIVTKFGYDIGKVEAKTLTLLTLVSAITMTVSSYLILYNEKIFKIFSSFLDIFHFKKHSKNINLSEKFQPEIILFGCHRMGRNFLKTIPEIKDKILIIDIDPQNIHKLKEEGYHAIYGDLDDTEIYEAIKINTAKIVISTVPSLHENKILISFIKKLKRKPMLLISGTDEYSTRKLYEAGADFVIYPHLLGSHTLSEIVKKGSLSKQIVKTRESNLIELQS